MKFLADENVDAPIMELFELISQKIGLKVIAFNEETEVITIWKK